MFWFYLACLILTLGGLYLVEALDDAGKRKLGTLTLWLMLGACLALVVEGASIALGWTHPLEDHTARTPYNPKGGIALFAVSLWPYVLIAFG